jgi:hypothetical protein
MRPSWIPIAVLALALAGCGNSNEQRAVAACQKAIGEKLAGKAYDLDAKDMLAKAKGAGDNVVALGSTVVFDKGLTSESKQTFDCRVQFDPKNPNAEPAVQALQFTW